jgi:DNA excision repair protein ERCC-2
VGILHPVLKEALGRGQKVVYVTPKNSQHAVAEDALERFRESGAKLKSLSITAKNKICLKNEPICTPDYCEYANDYYTKLARHGILALLGKKRKLHRRLFHELAEKYQLCPFELQIESITVADVIICDYNYVFAPRSALGRAGRIAVDQVGKPNLVIDEAHNLPARAMDYYSPRFSLHVLESMRDQVAQLPAPVRREAGELLGHCIQTVAACRRGEGTAPAKIDPPLGPFLELDQALRSFLSRYLEADLEIQPQDPLLRLGFYWSEFAQALELAVNSKQRVFHHIPAATRRREREDHLLRRLLHDQGLLPRLPAGGRIFGNIKAFRVLCQALRSGSGFCSDGGIP